MPHLLANPTIISNTAMMGIDPGPSHKPARANRRGCQKLSGMTCWELIV